MEKVAIIAQKDYESESIKANIEKIIAVTDFPIVEGKTVLVKPNILSDSPVSKAITTNPAVVKALIEILKEKGAKEVLVGESPGLQNPGFCGRGCGINAVVEETGCTFVDFTKDYAQRKVTKTISVPMANIIDKVDVLISVAKFKTHELMYTTGCVKNLFGLVPGINKAACHLKATTQTGFASLITGIAHEAKVSYGLMDAVIGMEGSGPANGVARQIGLLLGSRDCYGVDTAESLIMGYDINDIPILVSGKKKGFTSGEYTYPLLNPANLMIKDFQRVHIEKKHLLRSLIIPFLLRPFIPQKKADRPAPDFNASVCILCKRCMTICPPQALQIIDGKIHINTNKCIRCYCCSEMCPVGAIKIGEKSSNRPIACESNR